MTDLQGGGGISQVKHICAAVGAGQRQGVLIIRAEADTADSSAARQRDHSGRLGQTSAGPDASAAVIGRRRAQVRPQCGVRHTPHPEQHSTQTLLPSTSNQPRAAGFEFNFLPYQIIVHMIIPIMSLNCQDCRCEGLRVSMQRGWKKLLVAIRYRTKLSEAMTVTDEQWLLVQYLRPACSSTSAIRCPEGMCTCATTPS